MTKWGRICHSSSVFGLQIVAPRYGVLPANDHRLAVSSVVIVVVIVVVVVVVNFVAVVILDFDVNVMVAIVLCHWVFGRCYQVI